MDTMVPEVKTKFENQNPYRVTRTKMFCCLVPMKTCPTPTGHHPYFNVWKKWNPAHKTMSQTPENAVPEQPTMMDEDDDEGLDNDRWKTTNAILNNTLALCHDHNIGFDDKSNAGKCG